MTALRYCSFPALLGSLLALSACSGGARDRTSNPRDTGVVSSTEDHCAVIGVIRRECNQGGGSSFVALESCESGTSCTTPSPYNVSRDEIQCVDQFRFTRRVYPASCEEISAHLDGLLECLVPWHCSDNEADPGDWACTASRSCSCPPGGRCPVPLPPGPEDGGVESDAGPHDAGGTDSGMGQPDGGPGQPDGGPRDGGPGLPDGGSGPPDGGPRDGGSGLPDGGSGAPDGGPRDGGSGLPDGGAGQPDASRPDSGANPPGPPDGGP